MDVRRVVATAVAVRQRRRRPGFWGLVILRGPALTRVGLVSLYLYLPPTEGREGKGEEAQGPRRRGQKGVKKGESGPGGASIDLAAHSSLSTSVEGRRRRLKGWVRCQHAYIQSSPTLILLASRVRRVLYVACLK